MLRPTTRAAARKLALSRLGGQQARPYLEVRSPTPNVTSRAILRRPEVPYLGFKRSSPCRPSKPTTVAPPQPQSITSFAAAKRGSTASRILCRATHAVTSRLFDVAFEGGDALPRRGMRQRRRQLRARPAGRPDRSGVGIDVDDVELGSPGARPPPNRPVVQFRHADVTTLAEPEHWPSSTSARRLACSIPAALRGQSLRGPHRPAAGLPSRILTFRSRPLSGHPAERNHSRDVRAYRAAARSKGVDPTRLRAARPARGRGLPQVG